MWQLQSVYFYKQEALQFNDFGAGIQQACTAYTNANLNAPDVESGSTSTTLQIGLCSDIDTLVTYTNMEANPLSYCNRGSVGPIYINRLKSA